MKINKYTSLHLPSGEIFTIDTANVPKVAMYSWHLSGTGYVEHKFFENKRQKTFLLHNLLINSNGKQRVHFINGNKLDLREENLVLLTPGQIQGSIGKRRKNTSSSYKGVSFIKKQKKYRASITVDRRLIYLGRFETEVEAAQAYNTAATKYHGNYAALNIIKGR